MPETHTRGARHTPVADTPPEPGARGRPRHPTRGFLVRRVERPAPQAPPGSAGEGDGPVPAGGLARAAAWSAQCPPSAAMPAAAQTKDTAGRERAPQSGRWCQARGEGGRRAGPRGTETRGQAPARQPGHRRSERSLRGRGLPARPVLAARAGPRRARRARRLPGAGRVWAGGGCTAAAPRAECAGRVLTTTGPGGWAHGWQERNT